MNKKDEKILQEIQRKVYAKYKEKLFTKKPKADAILEVVNKSLTEERHRFSEEQLKDLQALKDSRELEGEETVLDEEVAAEYELEIEKEIGKAIQSGQLTHPDDDPETRKLRKKLWK